MRLLFIPDDGRGLQLAPNGRLPLLHIRSTLETWHLALGGQKPMSPDDVDKDDVDEHYGYDNDESLVWPLATTQIRFRRRDISKGVTIGCNRSCKQNVLDFKYHLQFGFDEQFKPVCTLYRKNNAYLDPRLGIHYNTKKSLLRGILATSTGECFKHDKSITFKLYVSLCAYIEVSLQPSGGAHFELSISEKRHHERRRLPARWITDFCFKCLFNSRCWIAMRQLPWVYIACMLTHIAPRSGTFSSFLFKIILSTNPRLCILVYILFSGLCMITVLLMVCNQLKALIAKPKVVRYTMYGCLVFTILYCVPILFHLADALNGILWESAVGRLGNYSTARSVFPATQALYG